MSLVSSHRYVTPTDIANFVYCPRLFVISRLHGKKGMASAQMVAGSLEHEAFRILTESFTKIWRKNQPGSLKDVSQEEIILSLQHVYDLAIQSYPHFALTLRKSLPELHYRINLWIVQRERLMKGILHKGFSRDYAISILLPWKTEDSLSSPDLSLYGRADAIYNYRGTLEPEDIKTHTNKFSALIYRESHRAQVCCYSILVERKYGKTSKRARIFYSRDLSYDIFSASEKAKQDLITTIEDLHDKPITELPPVLEGESAVKCSYCHARSTCQALAREESITHSRVEADANVRSNESSGFWGLV